MLRLTLTISLEGFVAGRDQSPENPLGIGGEGLHEWAVAVRSVREMHDMEGGETGPSDMVVAETVENVGATIMGRNMFGPVRGPWGEEPAWRGWWGEEPPFRVPVFVLTRHARDPVALAGGTTFHFVTGGIEDALERARIAAGQADVAIGGGASTARQYLAAMLVDRADIHVVPIVLGAGERLFEGLDLRDRYAVTRVITTPAVTHYRLDRTGVAPPA